MTLARQQRRLVARTVLLEFWRRQDLWILLFLMAVFAAFATASRTLGPQTPAGGTLMLNTGLSLAGMFAHGLVVVLASRQFPQEIENRTLYPLLARPLDRRTVFVGKWSACVLCGLLAFGGLFLIAWIASPRLESAVSCTLHQHLALQPLSLAWAAAFALALSLSLPRGLALLCSLVAVFGGETFFQWGSTLGGIRHLFPRFGSLNLVTRYTDGVGPLSNVEFGCALTYALLWCLLSLLLGWSLFARRAI